MATKIDPAQLVRQWGVKALTQLVSGGADEETLLWLALASSRLAATLGLEGSEAGKRAAAIRAAFGEEEPVTMEAVVNALSAARAGDAEAKTFLESLGVAVP